MDNLSINLKALCGHTLAATDGDVGQVTDFCFDDKTWAVRYLVVDTGSWLTGRLVLISPHAVGRLDRDERVLHVSLTRQQIADSPLFECSRPVSREYEIEYFRYYGWAAYWEGGALWGCSDVPVVSPPSQSAMETGPQTHRQNGPPLRSLKMLQGFHILAIDSEIGFLRDLMIDGWSWAIRNLVVETGRWYSGKQILVAPDSINLISYKASKVFVNLTKDDIQRAAGKEFTPVAAGYQRANRCSTG